MNKARIEEIPLVFMYGNRAVIADETVEDFPAELRAWVHENCERPTNSMADIWLLPTPEV